MNKKKGAFSAIVILLVLVVMVSIFIFRRQDNNKPMPSADQGMILFYSLSCPHCQNVEQYIQENNVKDKYSFNQLEISDEKNSKLLVAKAKICGLDTQTLGVPFLWTGEKCLLGDADIIDFFSK